MEKKADHNIQSDEIISILPEDSEERIRAWLGELETLCVMACSYPGHEGGTMERRRPILDAHDDQEREEIRRILSELPEDHPARAAHKNGADAIALTYLVERKDHIYELTKAWLNGYERMLRRSSNFRP